MGQRVVRIQETGHGTTGKCGKCNVRHDLHSSPTHGKERNPELKGQSFGSFCGNCLAVLVVRKACGSGKPEFS